MILILSQLSSDYSTDAVLDRLKAANVPVLRLNGTDFDSQGSFTIRLVDGGCAVETQAVPFDPHSVKAVWYRRWLEHQPFETASSFARPVEESFAASHLIAQHLLSEVRRVSQVLFAELASASWLSEPRTASPNKLTALQSAAHVGLDTPATLVTTKREELRRFAFDFDTIITKPIGDFGGVHLDGQTYVLYTEELDRADIDALPATFFPSLFQEGLTKRYELRVFYLDGQCHSAAIFSQLDAKTKGDFRKYNNSLPNRVVPYILDPKQVTAIRRLMEKLDLDTGSLDLVRTRDGRLVFLEVNPAGQFGMISKPCNYDLERIVANLLMRRAGYGTA